VPDPAGQVESLRVVVLSPTDLRGDGDQAFVPGDQVELIYVGSPYQAAAEMLACPPEAMIVDLNLMARKHAGLLEIADRLGTPVLGYGAIPPGLSSKDLRGVRLIDRTALSAELMAILGRAPAPLPEEPCPADDAIDALDVEAISPDAAIDSGGPDAQEAERPSLPPVTIHVPGELTAPRAGTDEPLLSAARRFFGQAEAPPDAPIDLGPARRDSSGRYMVEPTADADPGEHVPDRSPLRSDMTELEELLDDEL